MKTTAAARLLGARVVLTGVSPGVARTMVEIDADMSGMYTSGQLAAGIELALDIVGREITRKPERRGVAGVRPRCPQAPHARRRVIRAPPWEATILARRSLVSAG